jgi:hypothetical protein
LEKLPYRSWFESAIYHETHNFHLNLRQRIAVATN